VAQFVAEIHCVEQPLDKVGLAQQLGCVAFVEDNHSTAEAIGALGIRSYLLDAPYNQLATRYSSRVHGWHELLGDLLEREPFPGRVGTRSAPVPRPHAQAPLAAS
jgi:uncharacterized HAD superfamily protein